MHILVTGGLGYIGSHTVAQLCDEGHDVTIVDSCITADELTLEVLQKLTDKPIPYYRVDMCDMLQMQEVFSTNTFDAIIHFAALKSVSESVKNPLMYYQNNLVGLMNMLACAAEHTVPKVIFSSSATVYGQAAQIPTPEDAPAQQAINPYGWTKVFGEQILSDFSRVHPETVCTILRYFNPVGAHPSFEIGESLSPSITNLMPLLLRATNPETPLTVFGNTYETEDGTAVRDYIHVVDLAEGHSAVLKNDRPGVSIYNVGTGIGVSVLQIIETFQRVNNITVHYSIGPKRDGDAPISLADATKIDRELQFIAYRSLEQMCTDAWGRYQKLQTEQDQSVSTTA